MMAITYANPLTEYEGKKILVTGGTKGMGQAIAARFTAAGAEVMTTARTLPLKDPNRICSSRPICPRRKVWSKSLLPSRPGSAGSTFW